MTPIKASSSSNPQKQTRSSISCFSSSLDMYSSCQQSIGITPLYACAASLMISRITSKSESVHFLIMIHLFQASDGMGWARQRTLQKDSRLAALVSNEWLVTILYIKVQKFRSLLEITR